MPEVQDTRRGLGVVGLVLVLAGAALVLVSFRFLDWYEIRSPSADSVPEITFSRLHRGVDDLGGAVVASAYFAWLAWVLLIGVIAVGCVANAPSPLADAMRVGGFLIGLLAAAATYYALAQYRDAQVNAGATRHGVLFNSTWGLWIAIVGYLLAGVGAAVGPRARTAE
ncbi:MAG TPA: hypothetical protein VHS54_12105 [Jatrophihabitans sp.]|jgi:hypothetical protein|nr:hypothetical protein [Jatrophihabitans sp.]